jgi:hypothetical protein
MDRPVFSHQPTLVKIAVGLTVYNAFVFFEELIVDGKLKTDKPVDVSHPISVKLAVA